MFYLQQATSLQCQGCLELSPPPPPWGDIRLSLFDAGGHCCQVPNKQSEERTILLASVAEPVFFVCGPGAKFSKLVFLQPSILFELTKIKN